jgi:hypothetical protein
MQIDDLIAERRRKQGEAFRMQAFMDEFTAAGLIPMSLIQWEMLGEKPADVAKMLSAVPTPTR